MCQGKEKWEKHKGEALQKESMFFLIEMEGKEKDKNKQKRRKSQAADARKLPGSKELVMSWEHGS